MPGGRHVRVWDLTQQCRPDLHHPRVAAKTHPPARQALREVPHAVRHVAFRATGHPPKDGPILPEPGQAPLGKSFARSVDPLGAPGPARLLELQIPVNILDPFGHGPIPPSTLSTPVSRMRIGRSTLLIAGGIETMLMIETSGSWFDIGKQQGRKFSEELALCADRFVGLMESRRADLDKVSAVARETIEKESPHLLEETAGMAEGSGMPEDRLFKLRFYSILAPHTPVECSTFAVVDKAGTMWLGPLEPDLRDPPAR